MKQAITISIAIILAIFGLITLFLSSSVILNLFGVRASEGNYVLFVVVANFISSILYIIAAYGLLKTKKWTTLTLAVSAAVLILAFIGLIFHINSGGIYESKTIGAMIFRITLTVIFVIVSYYRITYSERKFQKNTIN